MLSQNLYYYNLHEEILILQEAYTSPSSNNSSNSKWMKKEPLKKATRLQECADLVVRNVILLRNQPFEWTDLTELKLLVKQQL